VLEKPQGRLIADLIAAARDPGRSRLRATMTVTSTSPNEQVELLVDRFSATLQKPSDFVDMPTRSGVPNGSSSCIRVAGPPTSWAAVPKPSGKQASLESPYGLRIPCALHE
jgi:hypothetical protein